MPTIERYLPNKFLNSQCHSLLFTLTIRTHFCSDTATGRAFTLSGQVVHHLTTNWRMGLDSNQNNLAVDFSLAKRYVAVPSTIRIKLAGQERLARPSHGFGDRHNSFIPLACRNWRCGWDLNPRKPDRQSGAIGRTTRPHHKIKLALPAGIEPTSAG